MLQAQNEFSKIHPGLVGGQFGVDPYYLTYKSQISGYTPEIVYRGEESMTIWQSGLQNKYFRTKQKKNIINSSINSRDIHLKKIARY